MLKSLSLRFKLILSFLVIAGVLAAVSAYQIRSVQRLDQLFLDLANSDARRLEVLDDINLMSVKVRNLTFEYQHEVLSGDELGQKRIIADLKRHSSELEKAEKQYSQLASYDGDSEAQSAATIQKNTKLITTKSAEVVSLTNESRNYSSSKKAEGELVSAQEELGRALDVAIANDRRHVDRESKEISNGIQDVLTSIIWLAFVVIGLAVVLGIVATGWITRSIVQLKKGSQRIANGDFSQPIPVRSHDEFGELAEAFNGMSVRLRDSYRRIAVEQQRDEAMLQGMSEGLIAINERAEVTLINKVAAGLLGLSSEEDAIGKEIKDLYSLYPEDQKIAEPLTQDKRPSYITLTTGQEVNDIFRFNDAQGNKYLLNISSSPVKLDGKVVGAITVMRDVTREKEVDRMKTEFISLASHQLRTPLSAIKWFTEMLVSGDAGKLQPEQQEFAQNIADSTERMIALVNALLNISRIESGRIMIDPKPTDLRELVSGIVNDLKAKTEEKQQTLIISVHEDLPKINLDPRLISQVYLNLLTNAIKYTPKGGEVSVFISKKDDQIISQVTDNGYGIPKDQQSRIFQKFFRAANAVKVETDGTGLGLYLIKAVVESSGGKIWFKSEEGKGTTFWFSMPMTGMKAKEGEVTLDI